MRDYYVLQLLSAATVLGVSSLLRLPHHIRVFFPLFDLFY